MSRALIGAVVAARLIGVAAKPLRAVATDAVELIQCGPRDGLQPEKTIVDTATKYRFLKLLDDAYAGKGRIEAGSFVGRTIPQFSDIADLCRMIREDENPIKSDLIFLLMNQRRFERAMEQGVRNIAMVLSPSPEFTSRNMGIDSAERMFATTETILRESEIEGVSNRVYISTCFFDPYTRKRIPTNTAADYVERALQIGAAEVIISDTNGTATPQEVEKLLCELQKRKIDFSKLAVHFHDTYGTGVANSLLSHGMGIKRIESSVGGLGGCPFAPGASGNAATEDLLFAFARNGIRSGINIEPLLESSALIHKALNKRPDSKAYHALSVKTPQERAALLRGEDLSVTTTARSSITNPQSSKLAAQDTLTKCPLG